MSFSFSAGGTKAQTLDSLGKVNTELMDELGQPIHALITETVKDGAEANPAGDHDVVYSVSAYGHSGKGHLPSLGVSLSTAFRARETPALDEQEAGQSGE